MFFLLTHEIFQCYGMQDIFVYYHRVMSPVSMTMEYLITKKEKSAYMIDNYINYKKKYYRIQII